MYVTGSLNASHLPMILAQGMQILVCNKSLKKWHGRCSLRLGHHNKGGPMNAATLPRSQPAELSALALAIALLAGCASTRPESVAPQLIAPGRVAIVAARYVPESAFNTYARGRGAAA